MRVRKLQQRRGWTFTVAVAILKPVFLLTTTKDWRDADKLPATGGCIVVMNHLSHVDPLTAAHLVYNYGRLPRYLAKSGLFRNRVLGAFMRSAGQIPVERSGGAGGAGAYAAAVAAVRAGECIVVYPEGTITRDPELWPMTGKSGAARIALETCAPVVPIGQWGAQELLAPYAHRPDLFPRKPIRMQVGDPVDLADLVPPAGGAPTPASVAAATERIMGAITALVEQVRGEQAPAERFDLKRARAAGQPDPYADRPEETST